MKSFPIPRDDMQFIEVTIDSMSTENNHKKKLDINDIMKKLETFYFSNKLDIYKPFIIKYTNYRNSEIEVMHIEFLF
jgi:hypothetical protein